MARRDIQSILIFVAVCLNLCGCGGETPKVWLEIHEDGTHPCLGASHLKLKVNVNNEEFKFDEFGLFFNTDTFGCAFNQYSYPELPLGKGMNVDFLLYDSSTDPNYGLLAESRSIDFDVSASSLPKVLIINLSRKPTVQKGTIVIQPKNWGSVEGVVILQFRVFMGMGGPLVRSGYIATFDAIERPELPLVITNLPTPEFRTEFYVQVDGLDRDTQVLTTWGGSAYLGGGDTLMTLNLGEGT